MAATRTHTTICRFCHAYCGIEVDVVDNRAVAVRGDRAHAVSQGFTCEKGRQLPRSTTIRTGSAPRVRRRPDGSFAGDPERAGDGRGCGDAAADHRRLRTAGGRALQRHQVVGERVVRARLELAERNRLAVLLHDRHRRPAGQARWPARCTATGRAGSIASTSPTSCCSSAPTRCSRSSSRASSCRARTRSSTCAPSVQRGLDVIVIDPRRTETAQHASHPPRGEAGRGPHAARGHGAADHRRGALRPLLRRRERPTPRGAARRGRAVHPRVRRAAGRRRRRPMLPRRRGGSPADQRGRGCRRDRPEHGAAPACRPRCWCARSTRCAGATTAPATRSTTPACSAPAASRARAPCRRASSGATSSSRACAGCARSTGSSRRPRSCDEILTPGDGQVRALICNGGNPAVAFPDQPKVVRALAVARPAGVPRRAARARPRAWPTTCSAASSRSRSPTTPATSSGTSRCRSRSTRPRSSRPRAT